MHPCALTRGVAAAWPLRAAVARPRTITRAFSPRSSPPRPTLHSTPAPASQQQNSPLLHLLGPLSIASIAAALPAFAAEESAISSEQLASTAATAIYEENTGSTDLMVTIIFTTVVALLTIVTAGVIYLGVAQALDKKQEMDSQQALKAKLKTAPNNGSGSSPDSKVPAAFRTKRDKAKGFGDV